MPAGAEVTVPEPVPVRVTVRLNWGVGETRAKLAVQVLDVDLKKIVAVVVVPAQAPDQMLKVDPVAGVAVSAMLVPRGKRDEQVVPQSIPPGTDVTVPEPKPALVTVSVAALASVGVTAAPARKKAVQIAGTESIRARKFIRLKVQAPFMLGGIGE